MDRKNFIRHIGFGGISLAALPLLSMQKKSLNKRPNILYILTDQQTASALSCAGNPYVNTPGMDKIALMGVRFENCYATQPLCGPNRTCMFTGLLPHQTGAITNLGPETNKIGNHPMLGRLLSDGGYRTALFGKWHIASDDENKSQHGFEEIWCGQIPKIKDFDDQVAERTIQFMNKNDDRPFFAVASFINPHNICEMARGNMNKELNFPNYDMSRYPDVNECPPLPVNFEIPKDEPEELRNILDSKQNEKVYPTKNWSETEWHQYLWAYYRMVEHVDNSTLKIIDSLEKKGLLENTIIIFSSDHGEGCGAHHWNQKQVFYEKVLNIPLIVAWKGITIPESKNQNLVSNGLDLFPTICDFASVELPGKYFGKSLKKIILEGEEVEKNEYIVSETSFADNDTLLGLSGRCLRSNKFKYIVYSKGDIREQLFDMEIDPGERNNLSVNAKYIQILNDHRKMLKKWCIKTKDDYNCINENPFENFNRFVQ